VLNASTCRRQGSTGHAMFIVCVEIIWWSGSYHRSSSCSWQADLQGKHISYSPDGSSVGGGSAPSFDFYYMHKCDPAAT